MPLVRVSWPYGCKHLAMVAGSWSQWRPQVLLPIRTSKVVEPGREETFEIWSTQIKLPDNVDAVFRYKFVVDGDWVYDVALPTLSNEHGSFDNYIVVGNPEELKTTKPQPTSDMAELPMTMLAHTVKTFDSAPEGKAEDWKEDALSDMNKNVSVQAVVGNEPKKTYKIVMIRHGESEWNKENRFCGWFDSDLSEKGIAEAKAGGKALKDGAYLFDLAHTSVLQRAQKTLATLLEQTGQADLLVQKTWRLNERHYGALTGLNKSETAEKHGEEQVQIWRRSFDIPPPPMEPGHPYYENIVKDPRYAQEPKLEEFPMFESLKLTIERTLPYWNGTIVPQIKEGKKNLDCCTWKFFKRHCQALGQFDRR